KPMKSRRGNSTPSNRGSGTANEHLHFCCCPHPSVLSVISCLTALVCLLVEPRVSAVDANSARPGGFQFDGKVSRQVLENYLSRSICVEGMLNGHGPLADDIRMLTNCGAKYVARALCLWGAENNFLASLQRAKEELPQVLAADP